MEYISQEMKEMKETTQDKIMSPSECLHGSCALGIDNDFIPLAPAKTNKEFVKVTDSRKVVSIF